MCTWFWRERNPRRVVYSYISSVIVFSRILSPWYDRYIEFVVVRMNYYDLYRYIRDSLPWMYRCNVSIVWIHDDNLSYFQKFVAAAGHAFFYVVKCQNKNKMGNES
jgi:hypothetical protein